MSEAIRKSVPVYPDNLPLHAQTNPALWEIEYLARNMRQDEIDQYLALTGAETYSAYVAAVGMARINGIACIVRTPDGTPAAAGGYSPDPHMPGVWSSWMAGTQAGWDAALPSLTKATKWIIRKLMEGGARRLETTCLESRISAREWYVRSLGLNFEGVRRAYCASGEGVAIYSITADDWKGYEERRYGQR